MTAATIQRDLAVCVSVRAVLRDKTKNSLPIV